MKRATRATILTSVLLLTAAAAAAAAPAAPGFSVKLLDSNRTIDSRDLIGKKVVVLRFQASWCKPCVQESAALSRVADRYRARGVEMLALHVQDTAADARRFVRANRVSYPVTLDPRLVIGNRFGVTGTPYTVVIDRKGEIIARIAGVSAPTRLPKILDETLRQAAEPSRKL
ncbi:MAG: TlpA family protein disulfide reductase [Candidatus Rokubacteria bacterium]|nr:TlpA family protein disulfide reductase [Candidatus Rokubacteria bacterium]